MRPWNRPLTCLVQLLTTLETFLWRLLCPWKWIDLCHSDGLICWFVGKSWIRNSSLLLLCLLPPFLPSPPLFSFVPNNRPFAFPGVPSQEAMNSWELLWTIIFPVNPHRRENREKTQNKNPNKTQNQETKPRSLWLLQPMALLLCPIYSSVLAVLVFNKQPLRSTPSYFQLQSSLSHISLITVNCSLVFLTLLFSLLFSLFCCRLVSLEIYFYLDIAFLLGE